MSRLDNSERTQIASLAAMGKTPNAIADEVGRDRKTVVKALKEPDTIEQVEHFQLLLADKFQEKAEALLDSITSESIEKMSGLQAMTAAGIAVDKARTIRGMSNTNVSVRGVVITTSSKRLLELLGED